MNCASFWRAILIQVSAIRAKRYTVSGRVQGIGFRAFVQRNAINIGIKGWVRNLDDGSVEAYAVGTPGQLSDLESALRTGPRWSDVRGFTAEEDTVMAGLTGFHMR